MKRGMHSQLEKMKRLIEKEKFVDIVKFCDLLNLSPSTFYNYRKFIVSRYPNIIYENQAFKWIETEPVVELKVSGTYDAIHPSST